MLVRHAVQGNFSSPSGGLVSLGPTVGNGGISGSIIVSSAVRGTRVLLSAVLRPVELLRNWDG